MTVAQTTVALEALRKTFKGPDGLPVAAVDRISMAVRSGQLTALVGPDGAGKTTLLRMIAGLLKPDSGSLRVLGIEIGRAHV